MVSTTTIADELGISYRRLDYWIRVGYLHAEGQQGSGYRRVMDEKEILIARYMVRLLEAGLAVDGASIVARRMVYDGAEDGIVSATLPGGVLISMQADIITTDNTTPDQEDESGTAEEVQEEDSEWDEADRVRLRTDWGSSVSES